MDGVDGGAGRAQRRDLGGGLAHPQLAQDRAGVPLARVGQQVAQREHLLRPHPVGETDRLDRAVERLRDSG